MKKAAEIFASLAGAWRFNRLILGKNGGLPGLASGSARFENKTDTRLIYSEKGRFTPNDNAISSFSFHQNYIYTLEGQSIVVRFLDERLFQTFHFSKDKTSSSEHQCNADCYISSLTWNEADSFQMTHQVKGPMKEYFSVTQYTHRPPKQRSRE